MRRSTSVAVLFAFTLVSLLRGQVLSSTGQILPYIADLEGARQAEIDLQVQKDNVDLNGQLLDFYIHRWKDAGIRAARLRIILWTIANHPDIQFTGGHDPRGLLVNPDGEVSNYRCQTGRAGKAALGKKEAVELEGQELPCAGHGNGQDRDWDRGHVWRAEAPDGSSSTVGSVGASSTLHWIYKPLRIGGEPVLVSTIVQVTVEPL